MNVCFLGGIIKVIEPLAEAANGRLYCRGVISVVNKTKDAPYEAHIPFIAFGERARDFANTVGVGSEVVLQGKWNHQVTQGERGGWIVNDSLVVVDVMMLNRRNADAVNLIYDVEDEPNEEM